MRRRRFRTHVGFDWFDVFMWLGIAALVGLGVVLLVVPR